MSANDFYLTETNEDNIQHFGIKGMKWGNRRYQNEDGTLTPAGKKRYQHSPEGLGYTPLRGKTGDAVQQHFGKITGKLEKKARKIESKVEKIDDGEKEKRFRELMDKNPELAKKLEEHSSKRLKKLSQKEAQLKTTALLARSLNKKYSSLSILDRDNISRRFKRAKGKDDMSSVVNDISGADGPDYNRVIREKKTYGKYGKRLYKK